MNIDDLIILNFFYFLTENDYVNLLMTCKYYYNDYVCINRDNIYKYYLRNKFSKKFENVARPIIISYRDCFARIKILEDKINYLNKYNSSYEYKYWDEDAYYLFWKFKNMI
jgi:hypothetical protein